jgi:hypothetical protein
MYERMPVQAIGIDRVLVAGGFLTDGATDPSTVYGEGFSVVRNGAGDYTVTLDSPVPKSTIAVLTDVGPKTIATELIANVDPDTMTAGTFQILISNLTGTNVDDAGSRVSFLAVVADSLVNS